MNELKQFLSILLERKIDLLAEEIEPLTNIMNDKEKSEQFQQELEDMCYSDRIKGEKIFQMLEFLREEGFSLMEKYPDDKVLQKNVSNIGLLALGTMFSVRF